ncbi:hypothetical protein AGABI1DRAFT_112364 [Agaricus bisporus var. burnettii JB137-S8]|uniref:Glutaredoxin domain-containing protein n=2 Tax=Agaricus bisporus var. burnettii TaxID=192524 RepID=K5XYZ9_AGABU|nr:hypothetical protein AGABI2DRAFT_192329 [Agaricus bisporus var. bisporus H97]XP_007328257.1 uncharacterized protein AGABI1DRAFT_112364 [Agaricus bisporus var. burnettii JB137-S8]EKM80595.1 hypothetical protein AGABI1DRAFT_112364 [Agaricus bisporus var. burnettii JB137-S8]EKV47063.1 hypothetical protein AGABI2DRAFT_192329 [Agaricus bisporus var. bisporus H97]KAF7782229.1 hypothetical protein Agabi119p4_1605 [Agaricus bisporus var. burnettii]
MSTRRTLIRLLLLVFVVSAFIWTFGSHLPESWKDTGILAYPLSRANILRAQKQTNELYGLLYLVTTDSEENQHILADRVDLDPSEPIALEVYAAGNKALDWTAKTEEINSKYPVIVFSKTFCPFSKKAKELLTRYDLQPPPKIIEVDIRADSSTLKVLLTRLTHHSTFPNVIIRGKSIGGSDDLQALHKNHTLSDLLKEAGVSVQNKEVQ